MTPYYSDDLVTIYHGDALDVLSRLPASSVDVVLTDPPYSSGGMYRGDRAVAPETKYQQPTITNGEFVAASQRDNRNFGSFAGDTRDQRAWTAWVAAWSFAALRATRPGGYAFVFSDWRQLPSATDAVQVGGWLWRGIVVWDKTQTGGMPIRGRFRNHIEFIVHATNGPILDRSDLFPSAVITVPPVKGRQKQHMTQKPTDLLGHILSVVPGGGLTILDPFMGSGSTLVAARALGHKVIGIEIEERYCEIAAKRMAQESLWGKEPAA